jgi:hypothetical protein
MTEGSANEAAFELTALLVTSRGEDAVTMIDSLVELNDAAAQARLIWALASTAAAALMTVEQVTDTTALTCLAKLRDVELLRQDINKIMGN